MSKVRAICVQPKNKKAPNLSEALVYLAVWTGLELFFKTPCIKGLPKGRFLGSPQGSPFNIGLTFGLRFYKSLFIFSQNCVLVYMYLFRYIMITENKLINKNLPLIVLQNNSSYLRTSNTLYFAQLFRKLRK